MTDDDLRRLAIHHNDQAEFASAQRIAFEKGEVYSLGRGHATDHDEWRKETIGHFVRIEREHIALRDAFLSQIAHRRFKQEKALLSSIN